ncbi:hypothetical protein VTJ83DRAFT_1437 [Remersonia thermophila]|uniref:Copper transport protein n=1 Tax=Remersonia thermophila TaxID=72144 RepID=A0ABR4DPG5_9PEZI
MNHMDHTGTSTMTMAATATSPVAAAATTGSKGHGMGGHGCVISMLWNWNTVDACFISSTWKIKSAGMFAGSCIGVILLVMSLEMLRRAVKEYDRYLINKYLASQGQPHRPISSAGKAASDEGSPAPVCATVVGQGYRPTLLEQAVRALLHMFQFAVAYFVMLLAMYYNGYIIICIFIGAYLGSFVFHWEPLGVGSSVQTSATKEATVCCG